MPSTWLVIDSDFPSFSKEKPMKQQVTELQEYMIILIEQLRFQLTNLNTTNWNDTAIKQFQKETAEGVTEEIENAVMTLDEVSAQLKSLKNAIDDLQIQVVQVETDIAWLENAQEELEERATQAEELLEAAESEIDALQQQMEELKAAVNADVEAITLGDGTRPIRLVGEVYLNGTKLG